MIRFYRLDSIKSIIKINLSFFLTWLLENFKSHVWLTLYSTTQSLPFDLLYIMYDFVNDGTTTNKLMIN